MKELISELKQQRANLDAAISALESLNVAKRSTTKAGYAALTAKRVMSPAARRRIAAAQKKRWAAWRKKRA